MKNKEFRKRIEHHTTLDKLKVPTKNIDAILEENRQLKLENEKLAKETVRYRIAMKSCKNKFIELEKKYLKLEKFVLTEPEKERQRAWEQIQKTTAHDETS